MKTRKGKRFLSALLAAIMVLTALPLTALAEGPTPAKSDALITLDNAINAYESAMDGKIYADMATAYDKYMAAKQARDMYVYGGDASQDLRTAAQALTTATTEMQKTVLSSDVTYATVTDSSGATVASDYANGLLYYGGNLRFSNDVVGSWYYDDGAKQWFKIVMNDYVFLYDGTTPLRAPVQFSYEYRNEYLINNNSNAKPRGITAVNVNNPELTVANWTVKKNQSGNIPFMSSDGTVVPTVAAASGSDSPIYWTRDSAGRNNTRQNTGSSFVTYSGTPSAPLTTIDTRFTIYDHDKNRAAIIAASQCLAGDKGGSQEKHDGHNYGYVINYAGVKEALATAKSTISNIKNYCNDAADMRSLLVAASALASVNPSDSTAYNFASNTAEAASKCATDIDNARTALTNAQSALTADDDSYDQLRNAIDLTKATYTAGNDNGVYSSDNWNAFKSAYEAAYTAIMAVGSGYQPNGTVTPLAVELQQAYDALLEEAQNSRVDTTALVEAITKANGMEAYETYFAPDTYANLTDAVANAKKAVWGTEENYGVPSAALQKTDENTQIVADQTAAVLAAIPALRINHDLHITSGAHYVSWNSILASYEALDGSKYVNFDALVQAVSDAKFEMAALDNKDMTTPEQLLADYTAVLEKILTAYDALEFSFTELPNGTVATNAEHLIVGSPNSKSASGSMVNDTQINGSVALGFSFPNNAVMIRTSHEATTFNLGDMMLFFGSWRDYDHQLLFFNLNDTVTGEEDTGELVARAIGAGQTPSLKDSDVDEYVTKKNIKPGNAIKTSGTAAATWELKDLYAVEVDNKTDAFAVDASGNRINDKSTNVLDIATSVASNNQGTQNVLFMHGKGGSGNFGGNTYAGAYTMSVAKDNASTKLTTTTLPNKKIYTVSGNVGAVTRLSYQPLSAWTTLRHDVQNYSVTATVVDIAYLFDLINQCSALTDSNKYTEASWTKFADALRKAKGQMAYNTMTADEILTEAKTRYTTLLRAYNALEQNTFTLTFNYKDANGNDTSKTIKNVEYGANLKAQADTVDVTDYKKGGYSYTFTGWDPEITDSTLVTGAVTYTAQYSSTMDNADFSALDAAVAKLTTLADKTYAASDLEGVAALIKGLTYYNYDTDQRAATMGDKQTEIDAETAKVNAYSISASTLDLSAAEAALAKAQDGKDSDAYDLSAITGFELYKTVTVNGKDIVGIAYKDMNSLNAAIQALLESLQPMTYTVYLNDKPLGTYNYGARIVVNGDGTVSTNDNIETETGAAKYAWYYSYKSVQVAQTTAPKYMTTAPSYGFVVKGNTYLTTEKADSDAANYVVTFVNGINGHVFDVVYTSGSVTMPTAPSCAFYTFSGYDNGAAAGSKINVTGDTTITAQYDVTNIATFNISVLNVNQDNVINKTFNYNDLVTYTDESAEIWVKYLGELEGSYVNPSTGQTETVQRSTFVIVGYGKTLTLRACEDAEYDAYTLSDWQGILEDQETCNVLDNDTNGASSSTRDGIVKASTKFSMIGNFALPENAKAVEYGMLFTTASGKTLTLENASTDSSIKRLKASKHTGENDNYGQYVVSIKSTSLSGSYDLTYRSYVTYTLNGKTYTVYADKAVSETVQF